jgi:hypothetical protein
MKENLQATWERYILVLPKGFLCHVINYEIMFFHIRKFKTRPQLNDVAPGNGIGDI